MKNCSRLILVLGLFLVLPAPGDATANAPQQLDLVHALKARSLDPQEIVFPDRLTEEMRAWARAFVSDKLPPAERAVRLHQALTGPWGRALRYRAGHTGTAEEVFASGHFNCLSFAHLFVALARELGIDAHYVRIDRHMPRERHHTFRVASEHVGAAVVHRRERMVFDSTGAISLHRVVERLTDLQALAMFYSNRGAEDLLAGEERQAMIWFQKASVMDAERATIWVNLGVALRRTGDLEGAERAYRRALEVDRRNVAASDNLKHLLKLRGSAVE